MNLESSEDDYVEKIHKGQSKRVKKRNQGQLTAKQANHSRLVSKIRFIVETQIGALKKFKQLKSIRNSIAGHINCDFRNACAMHNFSFNPIVVDGINTEKISKNIKLRSEYLKKNILDLIINKHFSSSNWNKANLNDINDFPRLKRKQMKAKLFFGSFQLNQSKSYIADLEKTEVTYLTEEGIKNFFEKEKHFKKLCEKKTKLIGVKVLSRHRRGSNAKDYKVYLEYKPNINSPKSIKSI